MSTLDGRHIVVTGGSRGLGRAMVLGLLAAGAHVTAIARAESGHATETRNRAKDVQTDHRLALLFGDLRSNDDCKRLADQAASAFGPPDSIVNNAGIPMTGPGPRFFEIPSDAWQNMVRANIDASVLLTVLLVPGMLERGFGRIVNVSTGAATMTRPHYWPYGPSKAFIDASTGIWAQELAGTGVTANVILPGGAVDTAADVTGVPTAGRSFLPAEIIVPPLLWLVSQSSGSFTGGRLNARLWDELLSLDERVARADENHGRAVA